jgi:hypothetical protein
MRRCTGAAAAVVTINDGLRLGGLGGDAVSQRCRASGSAAAAARRAARSRCAAMSRSVLFVSAALVFTSVVSQIDDRGGSVADPSLQ